MAQARLLVADSQKLVAQSLAYALERWPNIDVLEESPTSGQEAIDIAALLRPDVVLLDYWMTGIAGPAAVPRILRQDPNTKILLLSWFYGPEQIEAAMGAGAVGFLPKSLTVEQVAEAVLRAHAGENPVHGETLGNLTEALKERGRSVAEAAKRFETLTNREMQILSILAYGAPLDEVAGDLGIGVSTLKRHIKNILTKSGARSHSEAVAMALHCGLIQLG